MAAYSDIVDEVLEDEVIEEPTETGPPPRRKVTHMNYLRGDPVSALSPVGTRSRRSHT